MVDPVDLSNHPKAAKAWKGPPLQPPGGGGTFDGMEARVTALEKAFDRIDAKIDRLVDRVSSIDTKLASIDGKLDGKASAVELGTVAGRVNAMPTTWNLIALVFTILGGAFLIVKFGLPHP